jgi:hypothetical protein
MIEVATDEVTVVPSVVESLPVVRGIAIGSANSS